jgi:hypothetical protein
MMTSEQTNIDNLQTDSGSFSTRVTLTEATGSNLVIDSGSFSSSLIDPEMLSYNRDWAHLWWYIEMGNPKD